MMAVMVVAAAVKAVMVVEVAWVVAEAVKVVMAVAEVGKVVMVVMAVMGGGLVGVKGEARGMVGWVAAMAVGQVEQAGDEVATEG